MEGISPDTELMGDEAGGCPSRRPKWTVRTSVIGIGHLCVVLNVTVLGTHLKRREKVGQQRRERQAGSCTVFPPVPCGLSSETVCRRETLGLRQTQGAGLWV